MGSSDDDEERDIHSGSDQEEEDKEQEDAEFPSLATAAATTSTTRAPAQDDDPANPSRGKYARRRLGESKLARLERLEAAKDPRLPDEEDSEPEVDISNLIARVAAFGDSAATQAGIAEQIARSRGQHETASDVENDIDHSLAYLHEKEQQRQKAKGRGGTAWSPDESSKVAIEALNVDANGNEIDLEALQKEKEKAEAVRALKARFQGHGVGERSRSDGKARSIPSIRIGSNTTSASGVPSRDLALDAVGSTPTPANGTLSESITAEIDSSLANSRRHALNGETGSGNSGRSSFSTSFGRRKSPLAGVENDRSSPRGGSGKRTERIDSFLASLNDRSIAGKDSSFFQLGPAAGSSNHDLDCLPSHQQEQATPSTPGELGRLESFLDNMLG